MKISEHYSPSTKETFRIYGPNNPPQEEQIDWFNKHADSILLLNEENLSWILNNDGYGP